MEFTSEIKAIDAKLHIIPRMPDGTPAPWVMTAEEVALFMRWGKAEHDITSLRSTWKRLGLVSITMGGYCRYRLTEVLQFISRRK